MSDIDTAVVDSLKALDLKRPIREADIDTAVVDSLKALDLKRPIREADIGGITCSGRAAHLSSSEPLRYRLLSRGAGMRRREFLGVVSGAVAWPLAARDALAAFGAVAF